MLGFSCFRAARVLVLLALVVVVIVAPGCKGKPEIGFEISLPSKVVADAVWFEIGAFQGSSCSAIAPMLMDGVPAGATAHVAFRRDSADSPRIGDLARASYAFAAVARGDDCAVLATGCVDADVGETSSVQVSMTSVDPPTGACGLGSACQAARCVPANDNKDPSVGAQCSLELLGAGPLANPVGGANTQVSAPAIATTPSGFVIVYREIDPNGAAARVTVLPIDTAGGALDPARPLLKGRCANSDEFDGIGLVMNAEHGQIVLARSACGGKPGLELLSFTSKPEITIDPKFLTSDPPSAQKLVLSAAHVAAGGAGGSVVVFTQDGAGRISTIVSGKGVDAPTGTFGGTANVTGAWVAASDKVLAVLSAGPAQSVPMGDGGGGGDGGEDTSPQLGLIIVPASTPVDQFSVLDRKPRAPITFPGVWGAVAALGARVIVISDGGGPSRSVSYRAFDLDRPQTAESNGFSVEGAGVITTGDVTMLDDKAYIAALKPGSVSLHVYANATTTPRILREVIFGKQPRIPSVANVRDTGRVAVAATSTRVAVAWTTAQALNANDSTGGYAVFACTR